MARMLLFSGLITSSGAWGWKVLRFYYLYNEEYVTASWTSLCLSSCSSGGIDFSGEFKMGSGSGGISFQIGSRSRNFTFLVNPKSNNMEVAITFFYVQQFQLPAIISSFFSLCRLVCLRVHPMLTLLHPTESYVSFTAKISFFFKRLNGVSFDTQLKLYWVKRSLFCDVDREIQRHAFIECQSNLRMDTRLPSKSINVFG